MTPRLDDLVVNHWGARFRGMHFPCSIGRGGIGQKRGEGDGITPVGVFRLAAIKIRRDRLSFHTPYIAQTAIRIADVWSDDPEDPAYNHEAYDADYPFSHEKLNRADPLYDAFGILDFNWPDAMAGAGSAIFMHAWRKPRHPTEGCIAFDRNVLIWIFENWQAKSRVIVG